MLRLMRPDSSFKTFWRVEPDEVALKDSSLEAMLPERATLSELSPSQLVPGQLPDLWQNNCVGLNQLYDYFSGSNVVQIPREGYSDSLPIPSVERSVIDTAVSEAVKNGQLCLTSGEACFFAEDIPTGVLAEGVQLQPPPEPVSINDVLPDNLAEAWSSGTTTALAVYEALIQKAGQPLPWLTVRDAIEGAFRARRFELTTGSQSWPCNFASASLVKFHQPSQPTPVEQSPFQPSANQSTVSANSSSAYQSSVSVDKPRRVAAAYLEAHELQDFVERIAEIKSAAAGTDLKFKLQIEIGDSQPSDDVIARLNQLLQEISEKLDLK